MTLTKKTVGIITSGVVALGVVVAIIVGILNGKTINATIDYGDENQKATITIGEEDKELIESGMGSAGDEIEINELDGQKIKTVESIDTDGQQVDIEDEDECAEGEECGRGASFPVVDTSSWSAFKNATLGNCYDIDGHYGAQCWDLGDLFWLNTTGRAFTTCGKGGAKNTIENGCWQKNAGAEFDMIWNPNDIQAGDIVVFTNGTYGHVGMALGRANNGYVTLLGQNQGGGYCAGGGSSTNIINISLRYFGGAFRYKKYEQPTPAPAPAPTPTPSPETTVISYVVKRGDTLGQILRNLGYPSNSGLFGDTGLAQKVATQNGIKNRGLIFPGQVIKVQKADLK